MSSYLIMSAPVARICALAEVVCHEAVHARLFLQLDSAGLHYKGVGTSVLSSPLSDVTQP
jgi:hypothetical protein